MVKRRRTRRSSKSSRPALIFSCLLVLLAAAAVLLWRQNHKTQRPRERERREAGVDRSHWPSPRPDRREALARFRQAIERAGGQNVWVKQDAAQGLTTVLLLPEAAPRVEIAIAQSGREQRLRVAQVDLPGAPPDRAKSGVIQVAAYSGAREICAWRMREVSGIPRVAIVIDDLGQNPAVARRLLQLRSPLTFSVMPRLRFSRQTADAAHQAGVEVMLHLPMQPFADSAPDISPHEIKVGMSGGEVAAILRADLESVPYAVGVNNHMGSRATSDPALMNEVMEALEARRLFYIDSRTAPSSVALQAARRSGVAAFYRSVFLDDTRTVPYTLSQLRELSNVAERRGVALAIGHPYPSTIAALRQFLPDLDRLNIQLVPVSTLLRQPAAAHLSPGA